MRKQLATLLLTVPILLLAGCGDSGTSSITGMFTGGSGSVVILAGDLPQCDVSSFKVTITGITLTPQSGDTPVSVLSSGQAVTVDWASLADLKTFLGRASVPVGTYSRATLTLSNPQLTTVDFSKSPPSPATIPATLSSLTVTIDIVPPLVVEADKTVGLSLDFNLLKSLGTDAQGLLNGNVAPIFGASPVALATLTSSSEFENFRGLVQSFSTTASGSFSGSVVLQTAGTGGGLVTVNVNDATELIGVASLGELLLGTFAEIDAFVDANGNVVAKRITAEDQENASTQRAAFLGQVTSVTRLATGVVSDFTIVVREEFPDVNSDVPLSSSQVVTVLPNANFKIAVPEANHAQLAPDATTLGLGQDVVVHGQFQPGTQGVPPVVTTNSVYLRLQTVAGNFSSVISVGTDSKSGGFKFKPCSGAFQGQSISVVTASSTNFEGVSTLNELTTAPTLFVKGLVFFEPTLTSAAGVTLTPPSTVLVADTVHELP